jgi:hypothetical protein
MALFTHNSNAYDPPFYSTQPNFRFLFNFICPLQSPKGWPKIGMDDKMAGQFLKKRRNKAKTWDKAEFRNADVCPIKSTSAKQQEGGTADSLRVSAHFSNSQYSNPSNIPKIMLHPHSHINIRPFSLYIYHFPNILSKILLPYLIPNSSTIYFSLLPYLPLLVFLFGRSSMLFGNFILLIF